MYSTSSHRCYGTGNTCPSSSTVTGCSHSEDVTVQCCKTKYIYKSNFLFKAYSTSLTRSTNTKTACSGLISK